MAFPFLVWKNKTNRKDICDAQHVNILAQAINNGGTYVDSEIARIDGAINLLSSNPIGDSSLTVVSSTTNGNILVDNQQVVVYQHPTTHSADSIIDGTINKTYTALEKTKLTNLSNSTGIGTKSTRIYGGTNMGVNYFNGDRSAAYFDTLLPLIHATHCHVKLAVPHSVDPTGGYTVIPDDTGYAVTSMIIEKAQALGVVIDMLILYTSNADNWTQPIEPTGSDVSIFFTNHQSAALNLATLCNEYNIPIIALINECDVLTNADKATYWETVTNAIRVAYPNLKLSFASTTWNGETRKLLDYKLNGTANICDYMDFLGMNLYPTLTNKPLSTVTNFDLVNGWLGRDYPNNSTQDCSWYDLIINTYKAYNKPIMITEVGAAPFERALLDPLKIDAETGASPVSKHAQYLYNKTIYDVLGNLDWVAAIYIWDAIDTWTPFYWLDNEELVPYITEYYGGVFDV